MLPLTANTSVNSASRVQDSVFDQHSLDSVKTMGRNKDPEAMRQLSKKFEAMFVSQMLKTMREASDVFAQDSYLDSSEQQFHRDFLDQQLVLNLTSGRGLGLADQFYNNMMRDYGQGQGQDTPAAPLVQPLDHESQIPGDLPAYRASAMLAQPLQQVLAAAKVTPAANGDVAAKGDAASVELEKFLQAYYGERANKVSADDQTITGAGTSTRGGKTQVAQSQEDFIATIRPYAEQAARALNIRPDVLLAQAALETGWGKHVIHTQQGVNSYNLFNIKAGGSWQGPSVNVSTLEYQGANAGMERADFRRYHSYAESFADYVKLMQSNDRYQDALAAGKNSAAYAQALQDAGYATDPAYAAKIRDLLTSEFISSPTNPAAAPLNLASTSSLNLVE